jgi:hypothetical protein
MTPGPDSTTTTADGGLTRGPRQLTEWLRGRLGRESSLGWATEIEREAKTSGAPAIDLFFTFYDEYRAAHPRPA